MLTRPLGKTGLHVSVLGYGAMPLSLFGRPSETEALDVLRQVLVAGITFLDTADTYGLGPHELHHNERLIARALRSAGKDFSQVCVATKGGTVRLTQGWEIDGSPERLYRAVCESYEALGGAAPIPVWQHHWPDPRYSITAMLRPIQRAVEEGLVRFVGVGNYSLAQIKEARDVVDVVTVQNQFSLWHRDAERDGVLEYCEREGLIFLPWRPFGGREFAPRLGEIKPLAELAQRRGVSPQRLLLAWYLAKWKCLLPIPGSTRTSSILDSLAAHELQLTAGEIDLLDSVSSEALPDRPRTPRLALSGCRSG